MRLWILAALAACTAFCATEAAAQGSNSGERLPPASQVIADYSDPVQQAAACSLMVDTAELLMGDRFYGSDKTPVEQARIKSYYACLKDRRPDGNAPAAERRAHTQAVEKYENDDAFRLALWDRRVAEQDRRTLDQRVAAKASARDAELQREAAANRPAGIGEILANFWYVVVFALLGILMLLRFLFWFQPLRYTPGDTQFRAGGRTFRLYEDSGILASIQDETHTTHTPGTETRDQYGAVLHKTAGSTSTTRYRTLYIIDQQGRESASTLVNWDVTARPGNLVSVIWAVREGRKKGSILQFHNFSLDKSWNRARGLNDTLGIGWLTALALFFGVPALVAVLLSIVSGGSPMPMKGALMAGNLCWLAGIVLLVIAYFIRMARVAQFKRDVLPSMEEIARRNADAAQARNRGPVSRAD